MGKMEHCEVIVGSPLLAEMYSFISLSFTNSKFFNYFFEKITLFAAGEDIVHYFLLAIGHFFVILTSWGA